MTLSLPPNYVPLPIDLIEKAYEPDRPHRVLFASFVRLLALAWQNKYERTPKLREDELYNTKREDGKTKFGYLKLSRREYFTQKREMQLLGWLRSTHPATGFVQFVFSRAVNEDPSAENRTGSAENRTNELIEEEDSIKLIIKESSSSSEETQVRKTAPNIEEIVLVDGFMVTDETKAKMQLLLEHLHLIFDPEIHGVLDIRDDLLNRDPEQTLAWIAKAFQDRGRLTQGGGPIGLIVKNISIRKDPPRYFMEHYVNVLPEEYLEAVQEIEFTCGYCSESFGTRDALDQHKRETHRFICMECGKELHSAAEEKEHFENEHDVYHDKAYDADVIEIPMAGPDGLSPDQAWQSVLGQLQLEMPRASFDTWVRDARVSRYDGNTWEVAVRNTYAKDWLESRLKSTIERLLISVLNQPSEDLAVAFVVRQES